MATITEFLENEWPKRKQAFLEAEIYRALGEELTEEIKASTCELRMSETTFVFENCPEDIEEKLTARYAEIKAERAKENS